MYHSHRAARLAAALLFLLLISPAWAQAKLDLDKLFGGSGLPDAIAFRVQMEAGNIGRAKAWLDAGLDPDFLGDKVGTGLMIAAREGNIPLMELFLSRGADVNKANQLGETALMHAAWKGKPDAVRWLLAHGARVNPEQDMQWTALHYAVFAGHSDIAALLVDKGADVNARSPNGSSVLMMAVYEGHEDTARWLLAHGADTKIKNENGDGALEWAMKFDRAGIARMVASPEEFQAAANRPKSDWGTVRRSEAAPADIADLLRIREILASRNMPLDKVDKRIATLRARYARAALKKQFPPGPVLEITAERRAPARQAVRMLPRDGEP
ncbi:MAG TPA: ankyrin repeat domain-containing protein [Rhodocyclaceae bacterium]